MSLMRRTRGDLDVPEWPFGGRWLLEFPERLTDLLETSDLRVEEYQEDDTLVVRAEAPGIDPERDVDITIDDSTLRLKVERREEDRTEGTKGYRSEFRYGSFVRLLALPPGTNEHEVTATYEDGVLEVRVPVSARGADARRVPIVRR